MAERSIGRGSKLFSDQLGIIHGKGFVTSRSIYRIRGLRSCKPICNHREGARGAVA